MNIIGAIVILAVFLFGIVLWSNMVEENKRTRPMRVRKALEKIADDYGFSPEAKARLLDAHDKKQSNE